MIHYLMRHPAVATNSLCVGQTDIPISDEGKDSFTVLRQYVRELAPDLVISSDLRRCRDFAEVVSVEFACPLNLDARWREISFGAWENRAWDEIRAADETGFEKWAHDFQKIAPPEGESFQDLLNRVAVVLDELPREKTAIVVTHAGCIRAVACLLNVIPPERMFDWDVPYGAVFALNREQGQLERCPSGKTFLPAVAA